MTMYKTFKDLKTLKFPIYQLKSPDWYRRDGVLFIDDGLILDDKNMPGDSLGIRRIQCGRKTELYPLKKAHMTVRSLVTSKHNLFIDSNGVPFYYRRTTTSHVKYYRVKSIEARNLATVVWLWGISYALELPGEMPLEEPEWVGVLHYQGLPWIIYELRLDRGKDSIRRV